MRYHATENVRPSDSKPTGCSRAARLWILLVVFVLALVLIIIAANR
jgi:hypothetical protein